MDNDRLVRLSKYLSKHLRHQPERLGLNLAPGGWVEVDKLLAACKMNNLPISRAELDEIVACNDKRRFSFDSTRKLIRANQGHTVEVDLQLTTAIPPPVLYHGTNVRSAPSILEQGLSKMARHHVHLSPDIASARKVGARRGKPVVLAIDTKAMIEAGYQFYLTVNEVWLVESVPPQFIRQTSA
jgi:putative RNA 2'-phosphotransferase